MINNPNITPQSANPRKKVSIPDLNQKKERHIPITMLTAYDYPTALTMDEVGVDAILVGDSLAMVVLGYPNTLAVTMDDMLHHCKAVARGAKWALLIGDMPFMSYQISSEEAVRNAGRFLQEAGMDAVKLEGGRERVETIRKIISAGIPVMGHIGLTPQSIHQLGGFRPQGRNAIQAARLFEDALYLQDAGCFSLVLEFVPAQLASYISQHLEIPTIGIGAGSGCDGQVLVTHDLLGLFERFRPRFVKQYVNLNQIIKNAISQYCQDVQSHSFPASEHTIEMSEAEWDAFLKLTQPMKFNPVAEVSMK